MLPTRRKPLRAAFVVVPALASMLLGACDCRRTPTPGGQPSADASGDAQTSSGGDASGDASRTARASSPFQIIAKGAFSLRRVAGGPAYAIWSTTPSFVLGLDPNGALEPVRALVTRGVQRIGTLGATPDGVTYIESIEFVSSVTAQPRTLGVAGPAIYEVVAGERFTGFFPWREGSVLTLRSTAASPDVTFQPTISMHKARFEAFGKNKPTKLPILPPKTMIADQFAAYPDGRVLLVAAESHGFADQDANTNAYVLDFGPSADTAPKRLELPKVDVSKAFVSAGRTADEMLVYERPWTAAPPLLAKLEGERFVRIELDLPLPIHDVSRGDDGSLWITTGYHEGGVGFHHGSLYRVTIAGTRATATRVVLPPCEPISLCEELEAYEVVARSQDDVWITASQGKMAEEDDRLLHTQAISPKSVATLDTGRLRREAWAETPPAPYSEKCETPLILLGRVDDMDASRIADADRALADYPKRPARGRLGGERVWAVELPDYEDAKYKTKPASVAAWKKQIPAAKLVCAEILVETPAR